MGDLLPFMRGRGGALPSVWAPYVRRRLPGASIRLMIWIGLLFGLLIYQTMRLELDPSAGPAPTATEAPDPFAEARRSRALLDAQEGAPPPAAIPARNETASAGGPLHVIDGDTFETAGIRIRVADIDTPEVHGQCAHETELAARATQRMRALLAAGPFELHPLASGRDEDHYGRKLRIVTRDGRSLGDQLVAEGLARTWTGRRETWCA